MTYKGVIRVNRATSYPFRYRKEWNKQPYIKPNWSKPNIRYLSRTIQPPPFPMNGTKNKVAKPSRTNASSTGSIP
ncbi:MAG: hypothetical protein BWY82_00752 [Verrucomicrobia bacterium ADurb.Bin474]|nr:MAG: hypothetical protein BWY82_00752 [Verrucomicrobia bacterium ADurb.Bin474]